MASIGDIKNTNNIEQTISFGRKRRKQTSEQKTQSQLDAQELKEKYLDTKEGYIATVCDKIKCRMELGKNSDIASLKVAHVKKGIIEKSKAEAYLKQNQYNHKEETEIVTDLIAGGAALGAYTLLKRGQILDQVKNNQNSKFTTALLVGTSVLTGAVIKPIVKAINQIGMDKKTRKKEGNLGKDIITGAIDGLLAPVSVFKGLLVGLPTVLATNSIVRYATIDKENKSLVDFLYQQKEDIGLKLAAGALVAAGSYASSKNIENYKNDSELSLKAAQRLKISSDKKKEGFVEIVDKFNLTEEGVAKSIIEDDNLTSIEKMRRLEEENIFYPKYLQTIPEKGPGSFDYRIEHAEEEIRRRCKPDTPQDIINKKVEELKKNLTKQQEIVKQCKAECPPSRTFEEAKAEIRKSYGSKYYLIKNKALGVGSVAETYLAVDNETGKEVVIKLRKTIANKEKFAQDKAKIINIINKNKDINQKDRDFYLAQVEGLFDAWNSELNFKNEYESAGKLCKSLKACKSIKPIEYTENTFVMEKAPGVSVQSLENYMKEKCQVALTDEQKAEVVKKYQKIVTEQLVGIPTDGNNKIIDADLHDGNLMINLENLENPFTVIDVGNTIDRNINEAASDTLNFLDIITGNTDGIADYVLKDAKKFGNKLDKDSLEKARKRLSKELKKQLFSHNKKAGCATEVISVCNKVAREHNITFDGKQANFVKAQATYAATMKTLASALGYKGESLNKLSYEQNSLIIEEAINSLKKAYGKVDSSTQKEIMSRLVNIGIKDNKTAMTYLATNCNFNSARRSKLTK